MHLALDSDQPRALASRAPGRRALLAAAGLGAAGLAVAAPTAARADDRFDSAFMTAAEDFAGWDLAAPTETQSRNAQFIIAVGKSVGVSEQGIQVALTTAIVESWLYNLDTVTDGTSGGLFQQQPSVGWGAPEHVRHKLLATHAFFGVAAHTSNPGLLQIRGWEQMAIGDAAQAVQRSAHPARYEQMAGDAAELLNRFRDVEPFVGGM